MPKSRSHDILYESINSFYAATSYQRKKYIQGANPEDAAFMFIALRRENIKNAIKGTFSRRTSVKGYVGKPEEKGSYVRYIDSIEQIRARCIYPEDFVSRTRNTLYCCDSYGDIYIRPLVIRLTAKNSNERFIYGYEYSDWTERATLYLDIMHDQYDAERNAHRVAETAAEEEYQYYLEEQEEE